MSSDHGEDVVMDQLSRGIENGQNLDAEPDDDDDGILDDDGRGVNVNLIVHLVGLRRLLELWDNIEP